MNFKKSQIILLFLAGILTQPVLAKVDILTCEPEWQSLAEALGGDKVNAASATTALQDPHHIEARPSLIAKARRADMIFCTGADLEIGWLPLLLSKSGNARIQVGQPGYFLASDHVELIEKPSSVSRSQGDVHAAGNPHVHWDPKRLLVIADAFTTRLQSMDVENSAYYQQRYAAFEAKWNASMSRWQTLARQLQGKKVVVHHKNWSYLLNWVGIEMIADLEPKPGLPPTSGHLASLLDVVRNTEVDYILVANYQDDKGAQWLGEKSNIAVINLPFTVGGNNNASDLVSLYDNVLMTLTNTNTNQP